MSECEKVQELNESHYICSVHKQIFHAYCKHHQQFYCIISSSHTSCPPSVSIPQAYEALKNFFQQDETVQKNKLDNWMALKQDYENLWASGNQCGEKITKYWNDVKKSFIEKQISNKAQNNSDIDAGMRLCTNNFDALKSSISKIDSKVKQIEERKLEISNQTKEGGNLLNVLNEYNELCLGNSSEFQEIENFLKDEIPDQRVTDVNTFLTENLHHLELLTSIVEVNEIDTKVHNFQKVNEMLSSRKCEIQPLRHFIYYFTDFSKNLSIYDLDKMKSLTIPIFKLESQQAVDYGFDATDLDGELYIIGGECEKLDKKVAECFKINYSMIEVKLKQISNLAGGKRVDHAAFTFKGNIYVVGGSNDDGSLDTMEKYEKPEIKGIAQLNQEEEKGKWEVLNIKLLEPKSQMTICTIERSNHVYCIGGRKDEDLTLNIECLSFDEFNKPTVWRQIKIDTGKDNIGYRPIYAGGAVVISVDEITKNSFIEKILYFGGIDTFDPKPEGDMGIDDIFLITIRDGVAIIEKSKEKLPAKDSFVQRKPCTLWESSLKENNMVTQPKVAYIAGMINVYQVDPKTQKIEQLPEEKFNIF